ncbi:MAG: hypothetical protein ACO1N9_04020 [Flavobacterium sp.]
MNKDLQKLVDMAMTDGYLSEKEKKVLRKKAEAEGFDLDELDMILDAMLYDINKENKPKVRKCASCGEVLKGISQICPACDYVQDSNDADDEFFAVSMADIERDMYELRTFDDGDEKPTSITKVVLKIIFTGGLYIPYKLFVKKEPLFDRYAKFHAGIIRSTDANKISIYIKYGAESEISRAAKNAIAERDAIIKKRRKGDWISAGVAFVIIVGIMYAFTLIPSPPKKKKVISPEEKIERLITEKKIDSAKIILPEIEDAEKKEYNRKIIRDLEIDSLASAGNFDAALEIINLMENDPLEETENRDNRIYQLIKIEVEGLIAEKKYTRAKERAELVPQSWNRNELIDKINLARKLNKQKKR